MMQPKPVQWIPREPDNKTLSFAVDAQLHETIKSYCKESGLKMSQFLRYAALKEIKSSR